MPWTRRPGEFSGRSTVARRAMLIGAVGLGLGLVAMTLARGEYGLSGMAMLLSALAIGGLLSGAQDLAPGPLRVASEPGKRRSLVASFPDPVILVDERTVVSDANAPAFAAVPGLRIGHPLSFALRAPQVLEAIPRTLSSGLGSDVEYGGRISTEPTFEVRVRRYSGPDRLGPSEADPDGAVGTVALFLRDLTAQRRIETMRVDFVANVSHELRTPLASIQGFIETLQGAAREDGAARERFLEIMRGQATRMTRLIDDLLQLSRLELRAHLPPSKAVDLVITVAHMIEIMAPIARERGVEIVTDMEPAPVEVLGDRDELLRMVENLVANAIKYGGGKGRIDVSVKRGRDGKLVELTVSDRGPGIAPEHLPRLTERFYRVDVAESRAQGGTGLGLAIVKHIVGRHRGRLTIDSEPGQGARFKVQLPVTGGELATGSRPLP